MCRERVAQDQKLSWLLTAKTDWRRYMTVLNKKVAVWEREAGDVSGVEAVAYNQLIGIVVETSREVIGLRGKRLKGADRGRTLVRSASARNTAARAWRKAGKEGVEGARINTLWINYGKCSIRVNRLYRERREQRAKLWRGKVEKSGNLGSRVLWQSMKKKKGSIQAIKREGRWFVGAKEVSEVLRAHFWGVGWNPLVGKGQEIRGGPSSEVLDSPISINEVKKAVSKLKNMKATGPDSIANEMMKNGGESLHRALTKMFRLCQEAQWTPPDWNVEVVKLLHKGGPQEDLGNYRGVSLTSNIGKVFAGIIATRLSKEVEERGLLPECQAGFRKGRSVEDNLFVLGAVIESAKRRRSPLVLAFVDVQKAYDTVNRDVLWVKLQNLGISEGCLGLIQSLYRDTRRTVEWKTYSTESFPTNTGLRQGCPLSPLLFAMYVSHIPTSIEEISLGAKVGESRFTSLFYADDIVLMSESKEEMRLSLNVLYKELDQLDLCINYDKSKVIRMGPGSVMPCTWAVGNTTTNKGGVMKEAKQYKYLGVYFGKGKLWAEHMRKVKARIPFVTMSTIARARQSMDKTKVAEALWQLSVKRSLVYGGGVVLFSEEVVNKLEIAQNKIIKWLLGLHWSSSSTMASGILRWGSITGEIVQQIVGWWGKMSRMEDNRWPRMIFKEMMENGEIYQWYKRAQSVFDRYRLSPWSIHTKEGRQIIKENTQRRRQVNKDRGNLEKQIEFLGDGSMSLRGWPLETQKRVRQIICEDEWSIVGNRNTTKCPLCDWVWEDWGYHVIWGCKRGKREVPELPAYLTQAQARIERIGGMVRLRQWIALQRMGEEVNQWVKERLEGRRAGR